MLVMKKPWQNRMTGYSAATVGVKIISGFGADEESTLIDLHSMPPGSKTSVVAGAGGASNNNAAIVLG